MRVSIRLRLAMVYTAVFAFVLLVFGLVLYTAVERYLARTTDEELALLGTHAASAISSGEVIDHTAFSRDVLDPFADPGTHLQVLDANGRAVAHSAGLGIRALPEDAGPVEQALGGRPAYYTAAIEEDRIRVYNLPLERSGRVIGVLQIGKSYHDFDLILTQLAQLTLMATLLALVLAGTIGWAVAGRALSPVAEITKTALAMADSQAFDRRLPGQHAGGEIGRMATAFNHMLARLEAAYVAQRRFVGDASHELRAPLTTIKGNLEFLLRAPDLPASARAEAMNDALVEAERMGRLVSGLLSLARADAGQSGEHQPVFMHAIVSDLVREVLPRAEGVTLSIGRLAEVTVCGDPDRLKQLTLILVDNALKYTPAGGAVQVSLSRRGGHAELRVADTGVGIEAEDLPHVFDRFYRADKARARDDEGAGLGLAIAQSIVEEHGGTISVRSQSGQGSVFTVLLPCGQSADVTLEQPEYSV